MALDSSRRSRLCLLASIGLLLLPACGSDPVPESGSEFRLEVAQGEVERTTSALTTRLDLAGWPWFSIQESGPSTLLLRVGTLDAEQRDALQRLVVTPLFLEGFVMSEASTGPIPRPITPPTFTSADVEKAHLEKVRSGTRVHFGLDSAGSRELEEASRQNLGGSLAIFLDGQWLMAPPLTAPLRGGLVRLTLHRETAAEAHFDSMEIVIGLRGQLPSTVKIASEAPWAGTDDAS